MKKDLLLFAFWLLRVLTVVVTSWLIGLGFRWLGVFDKEYMGMLVMLAAIVAVEMVATRQLIEDWKKDIDLLLDKAMGIEKEKED